MTDGSPARSDGPVLTVTGECGKRPQASRIGVHGWVPGMSATVRGLLAIATYVAAILTVLFALVTFGAVWWQSLSVIVFGGIWYGLSRLRVRLTIERSR